MMKLHAQKSLLTVLGVLTGSALSSPLPPSGLAAAPSPSPSPSSSCAPLETIMNSYGVLEGSLQGAMIFFPRSQFATVTRELLQVIDRGTLNVHELYGLQGCAFPGSEGLPPPEGTEPGLTGVRKRAPGEVCEALDKVSTDVDQVADLTAKLAAAPDLPDSLYMEALQEAVVEAERSIKVVQDALRDSDGCVRPAS